jgi:hypothetical protein
MAMINYADKVALNTNSTIADINKCNAADMNEIKSVVNENATIQDLLLTGWILASGTFTFSSWDSTVSTLVVTTSVNLTTYINVEIN